MTITKALSMKWEKGEDKWISGIYKVVRYEKDPNNYGRATYRAYYIRKGDKNWGYYVDPRTPFYQTLAAAQAACAKHQKENPR